VREEELVLILGLASMIAGVVIIVMAMRNRRMFREMEHRERLAMIEHGVMPAPERDPMAFERAIAARYETSVPDAPSRARTAGIMMIALGVGFFFLVSFTAREPGVGIGVGGAFAILGAGFFLSSLLSSGRGYVPPPYIPPPRAPMRNDQPPPQ
jgi:uncharacterized protein YjeT (DUF2065 family)